VKRRWGTRPGGAGKQCFSCFPIQRLKKASLDKFEVQPSSANGVFAAQDSPFSLQKLGPTLIPADAVLFNQSRYSPSSISRVTCLADTTELLK
jgi:hypothetical protein